jgi:hypothetical protein
MEGYDQAEWVLADYGDLLVHIFSPKARQYYDLERLWRNAKAVEDSARVKIFLYFIGKPRDPHANAVAADFVAAPRATALRDAGDPPRPHGSLGQASRARRILLDPAGKRHGHRRLRGAGRRAEMEGRDLVFLVGGARRSARPIGARAPTCCSRSPP